MIHTYKFCLVVKIKIKIFFIKWKNMQMNQIKKILGILIEM